MLDKFLRKVREQFKDENKNAKKVNTMQKIEKKIRDEVSRNHEKSSWINISAQLTSILTLSIYLAMGSVSADYKGEIVIYYITFLIELVLLLILLWEFVCCMGWERLRRWISRMKKIRFFLLSIIAAFLIIRTWPETEYYASVKEIYGIPTGVEGTVLSSGERRNRAGYWKIENNKLTRHMTLTYIETYCQSELMRQYSTLYSMQIFQSPVRIEVDYIKGNKKKYRAYGEEFFEAARKNEFREPVEISYYGDDDKLLLKLKKTNDNVFQIIYYSPQDSPQLLNSTLLRVPDGQLTTHDMTSQQIEVTYNAAGLPKTRRLKSRMNLYGVSGERYTYDLNDQLSTIHYLDENGESVCNKVGIMTMRFQYDRDGNLQSVCYYSDEEQEEKTTGFYDVFCEKFSYENGNLVERRQLGYNESLCYDTHGVCQYRYVYNDGTLVRESFHGLNNSLVYKEIGNFQCSFVDFKKDEKGRTGKVLISPGFKSVPDLSVSTVPEQIIIDGKDYNTMLSKDPAASLSNVKIGILRGNVGMGYQGGKNRQDPVGQVDGREKEVEYESLQMEREKAIESLEKEYKSILYEIKNGSIMQISYLDTNNKLVMNEQQYALKRFTYDKHLRVARECYLDSDENICLTDEGYAAVETGYVDGQSDEVLYRKYLDTDGKLVNNKKTGYAVIQYKHTYTNNSGYQFDNGERESTENYLDREGRPVLLYKEGYAGITKTYDKNGFLIRETYLGQDGKRTYRSDYGVAEINYEYSAVGNLVCIRYKDTDNKPVNRMDTGYAVVNREFEAGRKVKEYYEGVYDKSLCAMPDKRTGVSAIVYGYNNGKKEEEAYFDVNQKPILRIDLGYAKSARVFEQGKLIRESFYGLEGEPILQRDLGVATIQYEYDAAGREKVVRYYDTEGKSVISTKYKCAGYGFDYDEIKGTKSDIWYLGTDGNMMIRQDLGYAHICYEYDKDGHKIKETYMDTEGAPIVQKEGNYAICEYTYENGRRIEEKYYDVERKPVVRKDQGYARFKDTIESGKCIETRYYDEEDRLTLKKDTGYAIVRYVYDEKGQCISEQYYDEKDSPVISIKYMCAGFRYAYDEKGRRIAVEHLGLDGEAFMRGGSGIACVKYEYDERGYRISERYYDTMGNPVIGIGNCCGGLRYQYDERGNQIKICYLNQEGGMMNRRDYGYAYQNRIYDRTGKLIRESFYDEHDKLTVWREKGYASVDYIYEDGRCIEKKYYDTMMKLVDCKEGYAIERIRYDEAGRYASWNFFDTALMATFRKDYHCAGFCYAYDENGNQTDVWYTDTAGNILNRTDLGYAQIHSEYDNLGQKITDIYYDAFGERTVGKDGYAFCEFGYENGDCVEKCYYDITGSLVPIKTEGHAVERCEYDKLGRCILIQYFDIWGEQSVLNLKYGCAGWRFEYDEKGNQTDIWYLGTDGEPMIRRDCGVSHVRRSYDDFGNLVEDECFVEGVRSNGNDGQRESAIWKGKGHASLKNIYENGRCRETQYYDVEGNLVQTQDIGYAIEKQEYDDYGQCRYTYYLGKEGQPVLSRQDFCAGIRYDYNEKGQNTDIWYIGLNGRPIYPIKNGIKVEYAHVHSDYDEMGQEIEVSFFDTNEEPATIQGGYSSVKKTYKNGECVSERFLDKEGKLIRRTDSGYAYYLKIFERGNCTEERYYDERGNLVQRTDTGYAVVKRKYNSLGQCISVLYCDETGESQSGGVGLQYSYDKKGNQTDIWYVGTDGGLSGIEYPGYTHVHFDYDDVGEKIRESYFDSEDNPVINAEGGYASKQIKYKKGRCVEESYYDEEGELVSEKNKGYAMVKYHYNELGQESSRYYYGTDKQLIEYKDDCAGYEYQYDERGNRTYIWNKGVDGRTVSHKRSGTELQFRVYDEYDNLTWDSFYVHNEKGLCLSDRKDLKYAGISYIYDQGRCIAEIYKDKEDNPVICPDTRYAVLKRAYNDNGMHIWDFYYGTQGELVEGIDGYAMTLYKYDTAGNVEALVCYDRKGNIVNTLTDTASICSNLLR